MDYSSKENINPADRKIINEGKMVPNLRLQKPIRDSASPVDNSSYSSRMKKRNQVHRSLDLCLTKCSVNTPRIIKANHGIITPIYPSPPTTRKAIPQNGILIKNRKVSRNIFLDQFPM